jgi:DNA polymerase-3 subunit delta
MLYVLHGDDEFTRSEQLAKWKRKLGEPPIASLNTTVLNGRKLRVPELVQACDAVPFLGSRRLVIVEDFWSRFDRREGRRAKGEQPKSSASDAAVVRDLLNYVQRLPDTTRLVFVEGRMLHETNPVFHALPSDGERVYIKAFRPPSERDLGRWIEQRMQAKGGKITSRAAEELARFVGTDLRQLDQELGKLLAHANFQGSVTTQDVHSLVSAKQLSDVFDLVDAIGMQDGERAMFGLRELLDAGAPPIYLLYMIARQFRILLQVKELHAQRATARQMQKTLEIRHAFVVEKAARQARNFTIERLESIYGQLVEVEQAIKTGEIGELLALDLLVAELCASRVRSVRTGAR